MCISHTQGEPLIQNENERDVLDIGGHKDKLIYGLKKRKSNLLTLSDIAFSLWSHCSAAYPTTKHFVSRSWKDVPAAALIV